MANTYDTSAFPLGSTEVKVLYNNAENADIAVNSDALTWVDRPPFNKVRKTFAGMEADAQNALLNTGFEYIGDYDLDGPLTITRMNQTFEKDGEFWRPGPSIVLPFTTTGVWATDLPNFVNNGDASLRTALSDPLGPMNGAALVGRNFQVVDSLDALRLLSKNSPSKFAFATSHSADRPNYGGGPYYCDSSDTTSVDNNATVVVAADGARWKLKHEGRVGIEQFGCAPVAGFDNYAALQAATVFSHATGITITAGGGTYEYGTVWDVDYPQLVFRGSGFRNTVLKFTGTGPAILALGTRPNNGAYSFDIDMSDFTIEGNGSVSNLLQCRLNHPRLVNINAREASPIFGCGFRLEGPVLGYFENLTMSTNTQLMTNRPQNGLVVDADPGDGRRATANTFVNMVIEGATGDGVRFVACDAAAVTGGTSENNGGTGITLMPGCQMNSLMGFDCESNLGYSGVYESGSFNTFINCGTHKKLYVDNSSTCSSFEGGWHDEIEVGSGAAYPEFKRMKVRFFGGPTAITLNGNQSASFKQIWDVQLGQFIYPVKPVNTLVVPLGAFTYTNNNMFAVSVAIIGGTISTLQMNRGVVAGVTALPVNGVFWLEPGDGLTFGGVTVAPTAKIISHGANLT